MYTEQMSKAFKAIEAPKGFGVDILDANDFLTIRVSPEELIKLSDEDKLLAAEYVKNVKSVLESFGAIVLIVREAA